MTGQESSLETADLRGGLGSQSYLGILFTQLLGALNDNMFRFFAVCVAQPVLGNETALAIGAAVFTLPYLLLAVPAGFFADRFSKRTVIVSCKVAEIAIMILGMLAILSGNVWLLVLVVALMGGQSALFSPAKYGAIPETVTHEHLSTANGAMGLVTVDELRGWLDLPPLEGGSAGGMLVAEIAGQGGAGIGAGGSGGLDEQIGQMVDASVEDAREDLQRDMETQSRIVRPLADAD